MEGGPGMSRRELDMGGEKYFGRWASARDMLSSSEDSQNKGLWSGTERDLGDQWVQSFHLTGSSGRLNHSQRTAVFRAVLSPN